MAGRPKSSWTEELKLRLPEALREKIQKEAKEHRISMNAIAVCRLEQSYRLEQPFAPDTSSELPTARAIVREFIAVVGEAMVAFGRERS